VISHRKLYDSEQVNLYILLKKSKIKYEYMTRCMEMKYYINALIKTTNANSYRFVIFANRRTGSHLLTDLLNCHPEVTCEAEVFDPFMKLRFKKVLFPNLYIKGRNSKYNTSTYGFNLKIYQLAEFLNIFHGDPRKFIINLYENGWKIIYIKRLNIIRQSISQITAEVRNHWHDQPHRPLIRSKVKIEPDTLICEIKASEKMLAEEEEILQVIPHLRMVYENDLLRAEYHQKTADMVFEYLGLSSEPVKAKLKKVSSHNLSDYIENYGDVVEVVNKTKYAKFLEQL